MWPSIDVGGKGSPAAFPSLHVTHVCSGDLISSFLFFSSGFLIALVKKRFRGGSGSVSDGTQGASHLCVPVPPKFTLGQCGQVASLGCLGHELEAGHHPACCFLRAITALFSLKPRAPSVESSGITYLAVWSCPMPSHRAAGC